jgi:hypothetical protein
MGAVRRLVGIASGVVSLCQPRITRLEGRAGDHAMTNVTTKPELLHSTRECCSQLFEGWTDPLETSVRATGKTPPGRSGLTLPATPKKRAKTPEQRAAELAAYRLAMRKHSACVAAIERERRIALGITSYEWVAVDVHGTCEVAKRNDGKVFSYDSPPKEGHVGEGECGSPDYCRCFAAPVVHGFS